MLSIAYNATQGNLTILTPVAPFEMAPFEIAPFEIAPFGMACRPNKDPPAAANHHHNYQNF
jgi:hypothetical protein